MMKKILTNPLLLLLLLQLLPMVSTTDSPAFYYGGTLAESTSSFTVTGGSLTYESTGPFGTSNSAIKLTSGQYLSMEGSSAPISLPSNGNVAWSASAWVKCPIPDTYASVLEWGQVGDTQGGLSPNSAVITVTGANSKAFNKYTVSTIAGTAGLSGSTDGQRAASRFDSPHGVAVDSSNNIYVADRDNHIIRKITPDGDVSTFAGIADQSGSTDGLVAAARFKHPLGIAVDSSNNVYVTDTGNHIIRKITPSGDVSTFAGTAGETGSTDGLGAAAKFNSPHSIAVDSLKNVYVSEHGNHIIRKISSSGDVRTFAGTAGQFGSTDGTAAKFQHPTGIAVDSSNNVYVADLSNNVLRKISPSGYVSTLAGAVGQNGFSDGQGTAARFAYIHSVAVDSFDIIYVSDSFNHVIRSVNSDGLVTTFVGTASLSGSADGVGEAARFNTPLGVGMDSINNIYVGDSSNNVIRKISPFSFHLPVCDKTWHHVALSYSSSALKAYVDGELFKTILTTISLPSPASSKIRVGWNGNSNTPGSFFSGSLADFRIYSKSLTANEVLEFSQPSVADLSVSNIVRLTAPYVGARLHQFSCAAGSSGAVASQTVRKSAIDNSWSWYTAPFCTPCTRGSWAPQGATSCTPCPPGTYSLDGASACTLCPAGRFGNSAGLSTNLCSGLCPGCPAGTVNPPSLSCASGGSRSVPSNLGMRLLPAAHPLNTRKIDLIIAPEAECIKQRNVQSCSGQSNLLSVVMEDDITRYEIGYASALNMEPAEELMCAQR
jgi:hypothetical protein